MLVKILSSTLMMSKHDEEGGILALKPPNVGTKSICLKERLSFMGDGCN